MPTHLQQQIQACLSVLVGVLNASQQGGHEGSNLRITNDTAHLLEGSAASSLDLGVRIRKNLRGKGRRIKGYGMALNIIMQ